MQVKKMVRAVALLSAMSLLTSCGNDQASEPKPFAGGTLVDYFNFSNGAPSHLDPALASDIPSMNVTRLLFDGLTRMDEHGNPQLAVAEKMVTNFDATEWTFTLRKDVHYSDGSMVRPSDFKFAWQRAAKKATGSPNAHQFAVIKGYVADSDTGDLPGVVANDADSKLTVTLSHSYQDFRTLVALPEFSPLPQEQFKSLPGLSEPTAFERTLMVGDGPFKLKGPWQPGQPISLVRNERYYGGSSAQKAYANQLDFRMPEKDGDPLGMVARREADTAQLPVDKFAQMHTERPDRVVNDSLMSIEYWGFNLTNSTLGGSENLKLRQAIAHAVDSRSIVDTIYGGSRSVAKAWAPPSTPGFQPTTDDTYSPDRARQLLREWAKPAPALKVSYPSGGGNDDKAKVVVQNLKDVGIPAVADPLAPDDFRRGVQTGTLEMFRATWTADIPSYDNMIQPLFTSDAIDADNLFSYRNDHVDALVKQARAEADSQTRDRLYRQAEKQMLADQVVVPVAWNNVSMLIADGVNDVKVNPAGFVMYEMAWKAAPPAAG